MGKYEIMNDGALGCGQVFFYCSHTVVSRRGFGLYRCIDTHSFSLWSPNPYKPLVKNTVYYTDHSQKRLWH